MKFTTKSRYALDALIDLYSRTSLEPVKISEIAVNQSIEMNYLEQLFRKLRIAGIIKSSRGRNGGYFLAMDASLISVKDVMFAVEEDLDATNCSGSSNCQQGKKCPTHNLWEDLNRVVGDYLSKITLDTLVEDSSNHYIKSININ